MQTRSQLAALLFAAFATLATLAAPAQSVPSAFRGQFSVTAGAFGSAAQPDFNPDTGAVEAGPKRLYGVGTYVDVKLTRWVQLEVEGKWMRFNQYTGAQNQDPGLYQDTYLAGPRVPLHQFGRFTPYAKVLAGIGRMPLYLDGGPAFTLAYGGGLDYRLGKRFRLRIVDFEYQQWKTTPATLHPYGASVGLGYKVF
jgi:hypothetical protein